MPANGPLNGSLTNAGGPYTSRYIAAVFERPSRSVTLTTKILAPTLERAGVPTSAPLVCTLSQAGPLTSPNWRASPTFGSTPAPAIELETASPSLTAATVNGLAKKYGATGSTTCINMVALAEMSLVSVRLTTNTFVPMSLLAGVPERAPLVPTVSQFGPLTLAKLRVSPDTELALPARLAVYGRPAVTGGIVNWSPSNAGTVSSNTVPSPLSAVPLKPVP